jgi:hypothetical protein
MVVVTSASSLRGLRCVVACAPFACEVPVVCSFVYLALGRILELIMLCAAFDRLAHEP